jgi:hypothetical protein
MKNQQHDLARELYFNTNLSKTDIAKQLNITRRTVYQWSVDGDWDKLRASARHMPAILAEKCYYLIGHFTDHLLQEGNALDPITKVQVDMLHKLTMTVNKLKRGSTVADNMETFTYLLERIQRTAPELAEQVAPHVTDYITARRSKDECDFLLDGFNEDGYLSNGEQDLEEKLLDQQEAEALQRTQQQPQQQTQEQPRTQPTQQPRPAPLPQKPLQQQPQQSTSPHPTPTNTREPIRPVHAPLHPQRSTPPRVRAEAEAA